MGKLIKTEDFAFLLFYVPREVTATGKVIFDSELVRVKCNDERGEKVFKQAIKLLNSNCPNKVCEWCGKV